MWESIPRLWIFWLLLDLRFSKQLYAWIMLTHTCISYDIYYYYYELICMDLRNRINIYKLYRSSVPRLALWICMHMHPDSIAMMGPDCSSWGLPARGSSWRSPINIHGNIFSDWVRRSTSMVSRILFGKKGEPSTCAYSCMCCSIGGGS